jgi:hypothetical protein
MIQLLTTVLPIALFWILAAVYLGGWAVELHGGTGFRQVIGLVLSFLLWVVAWRALHSVFGGFGEVLGGIVIATFVATLVLPGVCWLGYKMVGVSITKGAAGAH